MDSLEAQKFERIAALKLDGVPQTEIGRIVNLSDGRVSQIISSAEFEAIYAKIASDRIESDQEVNSGWDDVEKKALRVINAHLNVSRNPDFALKAALVANKAIRRGRADNNRTIPSELGSRVVVELPVAFLTQINQVVLPQAPAPSAIDFTQRKIVDILPPSRVEEFVKGSEAKEAEVDPLDTLNAIASEIGG